MVRKVTRRRKMTSRNILKEKTSALRDSSYC